MDSLRQRIKKCRCSNDCNCFSEAGSNRGKFKDKNTKQARTRMKRELQEELDEPFIIEPNEKTPTPD